MIIENATVNGDALVQRAEWMLLAWALLVFYRQAAQQTKDVSGVRGGSRPNKK